MRKTTKLLRRIGISLIGFPLVALGIILIPLPGPGILVSLAGLFVLSFEFEWANKYLGRGKAELRKITDKAKQRAQNIETKAK